MTFSRRPAAVPHEGVPEQRLLQGAGIAGHHHQGPPGGKDAQQHRNGSAGLPQGGV